MEFQVRYLALFLLFSVIDDFGWFWMGSLHKNIQLILEFLKAPFLVLHVFYYGLMTFLIMLVVILLSMLMVLLYSKCDQTSDLWQQLELASKLESDLWETVDWGKKWLVGFNAGKTQLFLFDQSNNTSAFLVKMDGSVPEEKSSFKMLGLTFFSKLDWASYITLLLKVLPRKFEPWSILYLFYRYYCGSCSSELAKLVPLTYSQGRSFHFADRFHDFSVTITRLYKGVYVNSFFPCTTRLRILCL